MSIKVSSINSFEHQKFRASKFRASTFASLFCCEDQEVQLFLRGYKAISFFCEDTCLKRVARITSSKVFARIVVLKSFASLLVYQNCCEDQRIYNLCEFGSSLGKFAI